MFSLQGRRALVTGASGGIGGAIAQGLHAQGASVALSGTRQEALSALAGEFAVLSIVPKNISRYSITQSVNDVHREIGRRKLVLEPGVLQA